MGSTTKAITRLRLGGDGEDGERGRKRLDSDKPVPMAEGVCPQTSSRGEGPEKEMNNSGLEKSATSNVLGYVDNEEGSLPQMLISTDRVPTTGRINSYSKPEYLLDIKQVLNGTTEFEWLKASCFGKLFELPIRNCSLSGRLVHLFLCRSLQTRRKHEIWFVFGGHPIRFSLREFALLTGLNCQKIPSDAQKKRLQQPRDGEEHYWKTLIGRRRGCSIEEIVNMLKVDKEKPETDRMNGDRRLKLCLLVLVDGILRCNSSVPKASRKVVEMLKDLDSFCMYPWGRESFLLTLEMVKVGSKLETPAALVDKLSKSHTTTHGFTLAIQLLIFNTVPMIEALLSQRHSSANFLTPLILKLKNLRTFHNSNILDIERDPNLEVTSILAKGFLLDNDDFSWSDEEEDNTVENMLTRIERLEKLKKEDWIRGEENLLLTWENMPAETGKCHKVEKATKGRGIRKNNTTRKAVNKGKGKMITEEITEKFTGACGDDLTREIERVHEAHKAKILEMFEEEMCVLKEKVLIAVRETIAANKGDITKEQRSQGDGSMATRRSSPLPSGVETVEGETSMHSDRIDEKLEEESDDGQENVHENLSSEGEDMEGDYGEGEKMDGNTEKGEDLENDVVEFECSSKETEERVEGRSEDDVDKTREVPIVNNQQINSRSTNDTLSKGVKQSLTEADDRGDMGSTGYKQGEMDWKSNLDEAPEGDACDGPKTVEAEGGINGDNEGEEASEGDASKMEDAQAEVIPHNIATEVATEKTEEKTKTATEKVMKRSNENLRIYERRSKSKRLRKIPTRFGQEMKASSSMNERGCKLLGDVDALTIKTFKAKLAAYRGKEYAVNGQNVGKTFFNQLYIPTNHVGSHHIECMLSVVWRRLVDSLQKNRVAVLDTWFTQSLGTDHERYKKMKYVHGRIYTWKVIHMDEHVHGRTWLCPHMILNMIVPIYLWTYTMLTMQTCGHIQC